MTDVNEVVAQAWKRTLGVDQVEPDDNFFVVGGTSLMAARLMAELNDELGLESGLRVLIDNVTCARLAAALTAQIEDRAQANPELS